MSNSSTQAPTPGQPIPTPPDFSVVWDDPRDAKLTWMSLGQQYKTPISPLIHAVIGAFLVGGNAGMEGAGLPFRIRIERLNTYVYMGMVPKAAPPSAPGAVLTAREIEVLRLLAQDLSNPQIAERLVVSRRTVDAHLRSIYDKLGVKSRDAAIRTAQAQGLLK